MDALDWLDGMVVVTGDGYGGGVAGLAAACVSHVAEEALHRVEWLGALVCSAQDKGALESREEYGGVVLCG